MVRNKSGVNKRRIHKSVSIEVEGKGEKERVKRWSGVREREETDAVVTRPRENVQ